MPPNALELRPLAQPPATTLSHPQPPPHPPHPPLLPPQPPRGALGLPPPPPHSAARLVVQHALHVVHQQGVPLSGGHVVQALGRGWTGGGRGTEPGGGGRPAAGLRALNPRPGSRAPSRHTNGVLRMANACAPPLPTAPRTRSNPHTPHVPRGIRSSCAPGRARPPSLARRRRGPRPAPPPTRAPPGRTRAAPGRPAAPRPRAWPGTPSSRARAHARCRPGPGSRPQSRAGRRPPGQRRTPGRRMRSQSQTDQDAWGERCGRERLKEAAALLCGAPNVAGITCPSKPLRLAPRA